MQDRDQYVMFEDFLLISSTKEQSSAYPQDPVVPI